MQEKLKLYNEIFVQNDAFGNEKNKEVFSYFDKSMIFLQKIFYNTMKACY